MLCLSPAAALFAPTFASETGLAALSRPYLAVIGPPELRFAEALPPPDLSVLPPAGAPPQPVVTPEPVVSSVTSHEAVASTPVAADLPVSAATPAKTDSAAPAAPLPPAILPDDTRAKVKPEDFLPFFQFPANAARPGDVTVAVPATLTPPAPGNQPPSSATYRQQ